jgi:hypothetical protein
MPDSGGALNITCLSPDSEEEQQFSLQPGESVYLGKDPQQAGARITLSEATSRVSRTAAKVTFQDGTVVVEHLSSDSRGVVTEAFNCFPAGGSREILGEGQQHTFYSPGRFEIPDAGGPHVVRLDFGAPVSLAPVSLVGGSPVTTNRNVEVWELICRRAPARRMACLALVTAWFVRDFEFIPAETIPTNSQLALLCGKTEKSVIQALVHTRRFLDPRQSDVDHGNISRRHLKRGPLVGRAFRDEDLWGRVAWGNQVLARWVMEVSYSADPRPITLADVLELDGLTNPTPAAAVELRRRGN